MQKSSSMQVEVKLKENAYKVYIDELEELEKFFTLKVEFLSLLQT